MKSIRLISILSIIFALLFVTTTFTIKNLLFIPAFGDGLFQEQLSASTAGRDISLLIKMSPPVVTAETLKGGQNPPSQGIVNPGSMIDSNSTIMSMNNM